MLMIIVLLGIVFLIGSLIQKCVFSTCARRHRNCIRRGRTLLRLLHNKS